MFGDRLDATEHMFSLVGMGVIIVDYLVDGCEIRGYAVQASVRSNRMACGSLARRDVDSAPLRNQVQKVTHQASVANKGFLTAVLIGLCMCIVWFYFWGGGAIAKADTTSVRYVVKQGDTLWVISNTVGNAKRDTRREVSRIMHVNHMTNADVSPGQVIWVPQQ